MRIRNKSIRQQEPVLPLTRPVELNRSSGQWGTRFLQIDKLVRNLAVAGALLLTVVALKNSSAPEAQSVFGALKESAGMKWDESIGKLSFVGEFLPEGIQAVWNEEPALPVLAPVSGTTVHAWSEKEPYLEIDAQTDDVRAAADGEVMSIAHGLAEERILRIRHDDGNESLYGNLAACLADIGERVYAGDVIARLLDGKPLAFELRMDGRSVDPTAKMVPIEE